MRIPLKMVHEQLQLPALVRINRARSISGIIDFVVDTGSNRSMIGYGDVVRFNLPESSLPFAEHSTIGGTTLELRQLTGVTLVFEDERGQARRFSPTNFYAGITRKKDESSRNTAKSVPSILGLDFLISSKLALYCNPAKNMFYLED